MNPRIFPFRTFMWLTGVLSLLTVSLVGVRAPVAHAGAVVVQPGMKIVSDETTCTVGVTAHDSTSNYAVTAGHCAKHGGDVYTESGGYIGRYAWWRDDDMGSSRYGFSLIKLAPGVGISASLGSYSISGVQNNPVIGRRVCKVGERTGFTCGLVGSVRPNVIEVYKLAPRPGDSGGPVYAGADDGSGLLIGILIGNHTNTTTAVVEPIRYLWESIRRGIPANRANTFGFYIQ